jgi:hypothetical protein
MQEQCSDKIILRLFYNTCKSESRGPCEKNKKYMPGHKKNPERSTLRDHQEGYGWLTGERMMIGTLRLSGFRSREFPSQRLIGRHCNWTLAGPIPPLARGHATRLL